MNKFMSFVGDIGDNIQTAVSVAKECGILLPNETVIDVVIVPNQFKKSEPEIFFNVQNITQKLVNMLS